jgi:hypothetical protein
MAGVHRVPAVGAAGSARGEADAGGEIDDLRDGRDEIEVGDSGGDGACPVMTFAIASTMGPGRLDQGPVRILELSAAAGSFPTLVVGFVEADFESSFAVLFSATAFRSRKSLALVWHYVGWLARARKRFKKSSGRPE